MSDLTEVERIKARSRHLRGTIVESLDDPLTGALAPNDTQLSKFHGFYQQDDRDVRGERMRQRLEPAYSFMIRARIPGGVLGTEQWLALADIAHEHANGTIRLTTRQAVQFHGVIKRRLKPTIRAINHSLLDTIAACGDVNRNVMAPALASASPVHAEVHEHARAMSAHLTPQTRAYHEIWLDGEKLPSSEPDFEPVYGDTYLPRKFKAAFVVPPQNDVDVWSQDLGFIAIVEHGELVGYNVVVGGGMGMSHGEPQTYPQLGRVLGFCTTQEVIAVAEAVVTTQRDFGDRSNRKHARLKYTIDDRGVDWFRGEVEQRAGMTFDAERDYAFAGNGDVYDWQRTGEGTWSYTLFVQNGRIADAGVRRLMSGLRAIAATHDGAFVLTPNQNLIIADVASDRKKAIDVLLRQYGIENDMHASALRRNSMACVAMPTCALAMAEAERYLPTLVDRLESELEDKGLADEPITIRMTGCPNGCARPYIAEIGLVGKGPGRYNLYLGAGFTGDRLGRLYRDNANEQEIIDALSPLFASYATDRTEGEHFGDYLVRAGVVRAVEEGRDFHG